MPNREVLENRNHEFQIPVTFQDMPILDNNGNTMRDMNLPFLLLVLIQEVHALRMFLQGAEDEVVL